MLKARHQCDKYDFDITNKYLSEMNDKTTLRTADTESRWNRLSDITYYPLQEQQANVAPKRTTTSLPFPAKSETKTKRKKQQAINNGRVFYCCCLRNCNTKIQNETTSQSDSWQIQEQIILDSTYPSAVKISGRRRATLLPIPSQGRHVAEKKLSSSLPATPQLSQLRRGMRYKKLSWHEEQRVENLAQVECDTQTHSMLKNARQISLRPAIVSKDNGDQTSPNKKQPSQQHAPEKLRVNIATKSSRSALCEHCCGEQQQQQQQQQVGSTAATTANANANRQQQQQPQPQPLFGTRESFYCAYTDSVSELSSYRFVSDEEEAAFSVRYEDVVDDVASQRAIEIERQQPKTSTQLVATKRATKAKALGKSSRESSPLPPTPAKRAESPTSCCYTIDKRQQKHPTDSPVQLYKARATVSHRPYVSTAYEPCSSYRRFPPPVPPKPRQNRVCLEKSVRSGVETDAEPALKLRRLANHTPYPAYPLTYPQPIKSLPSVNYYIAGSCCKGVSVGALPKLYSFEANNNTNFKCKFSSVSGSDWSVNSFPIRTLRYDQHGRLKNALVPLLNCEAPRKSQSETRLHAVSSAQSVLAPRLTPTVISEDQNSVKCLNQSFEELYRQSPIQELSNNNYCISDLHNLELGLGLGLGLGQLQQSSVNETVDAVALAHSFVYGNGKNEQKLAEDVLSNCSDQTIIIHNLDNECSQSVNSSTNSLPSSCASSSLLKYNNNNTSSPAPASPKLQLKSIPAIQTFNANPYVRAGVLERKEHTMEKRRNTLDRFQRFGFGRKPSPASATNSVDAAAGSAAGAEKQRKTSERSERLKELTELLRGGNSSRTSPTPTPTPTPTATPTPPPVPPPRKPRSHSNNNSAKSSIERQDTNRSQDIGSTLMAVDDQMPMAALECEPAAAANSSQLQQQHQSGTNSNNIARGRPSTAKRLFDSLRPNTSLSNLEVFMLGNREKSKSPPPPPPPAPPLAVCDEASASSAWGAQLSRAESRTVIGSYAQKGIPFRSVSFSQIDCKSTLSALRDRLRRDKAIDSASPTNSLAKYDEGASDHDPGWIHIPLKKSELCINLSYGQEKSLEHVLEDVSDAIDEEDIFNTDSSGSAIVLPATASSIIAAHAKMESMDTIKSESEINVDETRLPNESLESSTKSEDADIAPNLATLMEDQLPLESPPENFLQTATTCLIPVPVYECAAQEWLETPAQEWVEVAPEEEFGIVPETVQPIVSHATMLTTALRSDLVPTISVSRSSDEGEAHGMVEELATPAVQMAVIATTSSGINKLSTERRQVSEPVEQLKRYSHDDLELTHLELRSSLDTIATPRHSTDERQKRHLDKSTKRKGMYIDNADWQAPRLALDISMAKLNAKPLSPDAQMYINSPATPGSYSFELSTPELEKASPEWRSCPADTEKDKSLLLSSFSCQSSEEKDDAGNKSYSYQRTDSISDNECEQRQALASSRERVSPSPTPSGDYDYKRFSKRPLRGPYGQMLEAEMKKPNRMHFEEILEDLRETDSLHPRRPRVDDVMPATATRSNLPQYSNSMRVRKSNTYLPVPAHARAASTPSQIEHVSKVAPPSSPSSPMSANESNEATGKQQQTQHVKRAASEAPAPKAHHSKRSQSMSNEKPSSHYQHQHQHHHHHHHGGHHHSTKRSLDANASASASASGNGGSCNNSSKSKVATSSSSSPSAEGTPNLKPTPALLAELLKGSSENMLSEQRQKMFADTRTYVVQEIYRNEQSYVESLQTVVIKYLKVLKSPEHAGMIDTRTVDEIFFMVPDILEIHEKFLAEMKQRLDEWDTHQKVGDAFMETFSKLEVLEVYTSFVNNCNRAKNAIRSMKHQRPSFAKFLESTSREHKGKLTLDNLLIKPVQKFPNYELLFQRLIKHTDHDHPDQKHLQDVLKLVHDILVHINGKEREIMENGQREATLRELEGVIEGITDLIAPERQFLLFDLVSMPSGQGARKERGFFLFNDLLVLTSIKKRSGTIRKPNSSICPGTVATTLDTNKYKFLTKISLDCLEIVKSKDENIKRIVSEIENLAEDCNKLQQITDITISLKYPHQYLEDVIRELHRDVQRQLSERQTNDTQLNMLELTVSSPSGSQKLNVVFSKTEKRSQWEEAFNEAKHKLAATLERHPIPEFLTSIPIRKTRAGLQFTCAAATLSDKRDVWVCNSDGYVGQVCIMSLHPEPNVTSCNGVCNARILCVASVPAYSASASTSEQSASQPDKHKRNTPPHSYTQQLRDYRKSISPSYQPPASTTMAPASVTPERKKTPTSTTSNGAALATTGSSNSDTQLDLNLSSSDDEVDAAAAAAVAAISGGSSAGSTGSAMLEREHSPAPSMHAAMSATGVYHAHQDSNPEESEYNQSTMWIGTEDGCIHVYNSTDNIRIKKNRIKIEHHSAVYSILYLDNRVFVSLANGDICVYLRDGATSWNTCSSHCLSIGTVTSPVTKLLNVHGKLWCSIQGIIKVLDIETLSVINQIQISSDSKPITNMTVSSNCVWISIQNSAHIKCFHSNTHQLITEVNLAPAVNKMLSNCDEIIRQHKAACLRVTSLLCCKDLIWIGTSAGVLLTIPAQGYDKSAPNIVPTGIPHGHTGHVRFLTFVETTGLESSASLQAGTAAAPRECGGGNSDEYTKQGSSKHSKAKPETNNILIISGGDGYEDFRNSGANSLSEIAGREDSTNHLLIWQI